MANSNHILVVEDKAEWRNDLISILEDEGYEVDSAEDFHRARERLRRRSYAVLTVDLNLREGDEDGSGGMLKHGELILRYIQRNHPAARCVVVSGSVITKREVRDLLKEKGAWDFMSKAEFDWRDFLRMVKDAMEDSLAFQDALRSESSTDEDEPTDARIDTAELHRALSQRFDEGELDTLCFNLAIDYENLRGDSKSDRARELIKFLMRRNRLDELLNEGQEMRPDIEWRQF